MIVSERGLPIFTSVFTWYQGKYMEKPQKPFLSGSSAFVVRVLKSNKYLFILGTALSNCKAFFLIPDHIRFHIE
jgi:hypothetical protein